MALNSSINSGGKEWAKNKKPERNSSFRSYN